MSAVRGKPLPPAAKIRCNTYQGNKCKGTLDLRTRKHCSPTPLMDLGQFKRPCFCLLLLCDLHPQMLEVHKRVAYACRRPIREDALIASDKNILKAEVIMNQRVRDSNRL